MPLGIRQFSPSSRHTQASIAEVRIFHRRKAPAFLHFGLVVLLVACAFGSNRLAAQSAQEREVPVVNAFRLGVDDHISLDGRLDDDVWQQIEPITTFLQQEPVEGGIPTEATEVRIAHDGSALYIGVIAFDSEPAGILAFQRRRNAGLGTDDRFMWIIDTFGDGRTAYFFETNPLGLKGDGLLRTGQGGGLNKSWDAIWEVRTSRGDYGWSAEIRIPFHTLNFDPDSDTWGINFQRTIRRKNEELLWTGHRRNQGLTRPQHAGILAGMRGVSQGVGLELRPYGLASAADPLVGQSTATADAGVDLSYSFTSNLRGSLSINTDFAEVEVDQRRVNLTRFPLFFPEQRDFFLEAASVFSFAAASGMTPFFSRRIGLAEGRPVPIQFGARLNGQIADTDVGFFQIRTGASGALPAEDFTAARLRRNIFAQSAAGLIYTRRAPLGSAPDALDQHTFGVDTDLETSRFLGDRNLQFQAFWVWTSPAAPSDAASFMDRSARGVRLSFPNDPWSGHVSFRTLGPDYRPAVGFVSRTGFHRIQPTVSFAPLISRSSVLRRMVWTLTAEYLTDMDYQPVTTGLGLTFVDLRFDRGDRVFASVGRDFERLLEPFRIFGRDDLTVPAGSYNTWRLSAGARSAPQLPLSGGLDYTREGFWTGTRDRVSADATVRPAAGVALSGQYSLNRISLTEGSADAHLAILSSNLDFSPATSVSTSLQFDNLSDTIGLFGRFRWIARPGTELFFVYSHNWLVDDGEFSTLERSGTTKLTYTHWF